jgi:hypothetical protein
MDGEHQAQTNEDNLESLQRIIERRQQARVLPDSSSNGRTTASA